MCKKIAIVQCKHCCKEIKVKGGEFTSWNEILGIALFQVANHNLLHFASGTDCYSKMLKELEK